METTNRTPIVVVEEDSPIGRLTIGLRDGILVALLIEADAREFDTLVGRRAEIERRTFAECSDTDRETLDALRRYFEGEVEAIESLPVEALGSAFQHRVWDALREIPPGTTISYVELARRVGQPSASRAVGRANATNPVAIVVPCHRVIRADGALGGYASGLDRKRWLLDHEERASGAAAPVGQVRLAAW